MCRTCVLLLCRQEASLILSPSHDAKLLDRQLATLEATGATGIMLDVWCAPLSVCKLSKALYACVAHCCTLPKFVVAFATHRPHLTSAATLQVGHMRAEGPEGVRLQRIHGGML